MTEKEFRKLRPLDLIQLLVAQGNEASRLQAELDGKNEKLALLKEDNDILKAKLNDRDALVDLLKVKLDESDADIRELERVTEELYSDKWIDLEEMGSLTEAVHEIYKIFEEAQKEAEECLRGERTEIRELLKPELPVVEEPQPVIEDVEEIPNAESECSIEEKSVPESVPEEPSEFEPEPVLEEPSEPEPEPVLEEPSEPEPEPVPEELSEPEPESVPEETSNPEPTPALEEPSGTEPQKESINKEPINIEETHSKPTAAKSQRKKLFAGLKFGRHR